MSDFLPRRPLAHRRLLHDVAVARAGEASPAAAAAQQQQQQQQQQEQEQHAARQWRVTQPQQQQ